MKTLKHLSALVVVFLFSLIVINCEKTESENEYIEGGLKSALSYEDFYLEDVCIGGGIITGEVSI